MLICRSRNIYYNNQSWKQFFCLIFSWIHAWQRCFTLKVILHVVQRYRKWYEAFSSKTIKKKEFPPKSVLYLVGMEKSIFNLTQNAISAILFCHVFSLTFQTVTNANPPSLQNVIHPFNQSQRTIPRTVDRNGGALNIAFWNQTLHIFIYIDSYALSVTLYVFLTCLSLFL